MPQILGLWEISTKARNLDLSFPLRLLIWENGPLGAMQELGVIFSFFELHWITGWASESKTWFKNISSSKVICSVIYSLTWVLSAVYHLLGFLTSLLLSHKCSFVCILLLIWYLWKIGPEVFYSVILMIPYYSFYLKKGDTFSSPRIY